MTQPASAGGSSVTAGAPAGTGSSVGGAQARAGIGGSTSSAPIPTAAIGGRPANGGAGTGTAGVGTAGMNSAGTSSAGMNAAGAGTAGTTTPATGTGGVAGGSPAMDPDTCKVGPIPDDVRAEYKLDPFYTRYASADGTPIVATNNPVEEAIRRACFVVLDQSSTVPMARQSMRTNHVYFIMMAKNEKTVQTPEYRSRGDLDQRARGFGNNPGLCAEENVMCDRTTDRWRGESICVHEYSHVMHLYVWSKVVPQFDSKVNAAFQNAVRTMGKYANTYAASNATEYFAEGVQNWYNTNLQSSRGEAGDGVHNHINTRAELKAYDPMLYDLLATVLPDVPKYKDCYYYE